MAIGRYDWARAAFDQALDLTANTDSASVVGASPAGVRATDRAADPARDALASLRRRAHDNLDLLCRGERAPGGLTVDKECGLLDPLRQARERVYVATPASTRSAVSENAQIWERHRARGQGRRAFREEAPPALGVGWAAATPHRAHRLFKAES